MAAGAALVALVLVCYAGTLRNGFVWDDDAYVTNNGLLRDAGGLGRIWTAPRLSPQYYPVTFSVFWAQYQVWGGAAAAGYHAVNVLLHAANGVLVWRVFRRLGVPGAWWAGAAFGVHPVAVESVAWMTELKNVLSLHFALWAARCYLGFRPPGGEGAGGSGWAYAGALALFACALLSKSVAAVLPVALLLVAWWKRGRLGARDVWPLIPFVVLGAVAGLGTAWLEVSHVGARGAEWSLSLPARLQVAGRGLWFYAGKLAWPHPLSFVYPRRQPDPGAAADYLPLAGFAVVVAALWGARRRVGRGPLAGVLAFAVFLFPALGLFNVYPMRYSFVADHFQYMAAPCLIALAAAGGHALWRRADDRGARRARGAVVGAGLLVIACFAVLTVRQTRCYRDSETLWRDVLAKNPGAWIAHDNLAVILAARGENGAAGDHLRRSIGLKPDHAVSRANLGRVYLALGDARAAEGELREAVRLDPDAAGAHEDLGRVLAGRGDGAGAARSFAEVVRLRPADVGARRDLAVALAVDGQIDRAVEEFRAGLRIAGDSVDCLNGLAWLLAVTPGRTASERSEAVGLAERAVALTGGRAPRTLDTLGAAYAAVGRFDRAVACGEAAVGLVATAGERALEAELRGRVEGYRAGRPFVEHARGR